MIRIRIYLLVFGLLFSQQLIGQESKYAQSDTIPFDFTSYNNIVVDALINDADSVRLMFHTAANDISLIEESTKNMNSISWNDTASDIVSWGGSSGQSRMSANNTVQVGRFGLDSLTIWENKNSGHTTDGKFGPNFFEGDFIEINFDSSVMIIHSAMPSTINGYTKLPLRSENGFMFIEAVSIVGNKEFPNQYLIHSGYSGSILYDDQFVEDSKIAEHIEVTGEKRLSDSAGNVLIESKGKLGKLLLGDAVFQDISVGFFQGALGRQKISVLGGNLLKRFNIIIHANRETIYLKANSLHSEPFGQG